MEESIVRALRIGHLERCLALDAANKPDPNDVSDLRWIPMVSELKLWVETQR